MRKMLILIGAAAITTATILSTQADLEWGYSANLADWDAGVEGNWLVQMYHDVNANSLLGIVTHFDTSGGVFGGDSDDDVLLASAFTALTVDGKAGVVWAESIAPATWAFLQNEDVYSVLFNASTIAGATQAVIIDASPFTLAGSDPATYIQGTVDNDWVNVIPEPSTMALLGMGVVGLLGLRRRMVK